MRRVGSKGAPTKEAFIESAKTAKKKDGGGVSLAVGRGEKLPTNKGAGPVSYTHLTLPTKRIV